MARVTTVKSARKSPGSCQVCQKEIVKGDSYLWWAFYRAGKNIRCLDHPPRGSETTGSETESMSLAIDEAFATEVTPESSEDAEELRDSIVDQVQEIIDVIQDKMDNIESGFGHTEVEAYYFQEEQHDAYDSWMDEIGNLDIDQFSDDGDGCEECGMAYGEGDHEVKDDGRFAVGGHYFEAEVVFYGDEFMEELRELVGQGAGG